MLRHDPFDVEPAHHLRPQPAHAIAAHVAAVERRHQRQVRIKIFHRCGSHIGMHHRRSQVARKQDARLRIVELEVAFRVQEVRRHRQHVRVAERDRHARIRNRHDATLGLAHVAEVRHKPLPHARDQDVAARTREPSSGGGNDVRVGMRGEHIVELLRRKVAVHRQEERVVCHLAAWVDERAVAVVDDEELVGLHRQSVVVVDEVGKHQADVLGRFIQGSDHGGQGAVGMPRWSRSAARRRLIRVKARVTRQEPGAARCRSCLGCT